MLKVQVSSDPSCFSSLAEEWLNLLENSPSNYIFQTPQFLHIWWKSLGSGKLQIVTFRDVEKDNHLVGIAPFFVHPDNHRQVLSFVGCVNVSDYLDVIISQNYLQEVYAKLAQQLQAHLFWDKLYLCSLPEKSETIEWLKKLFPKLKQTQQDVAPAIELPKSWDDYLNSLKRKQRHEIKRKQRRLAEVEHKFELITSAEDTQRATNDFIQLHKLSSADKHDFWDHRHLKFFRQLLPALAERGWLKLYFLKIRSERAAAMLVFDYHNQYLLYNSGFDPKKFKELSTGNLLTAHTIQEAIRLGRSRYDFLRGDEEYKFRFGAQPHPIWDLSLEASALDL